MFIFLLLFSTNLYALCVNDQYLKTFPKDTIPRVNMSNCLSSDFFETEEACKCAWNQKKIFNIKSDNSYFRNEIRNKAIDEISNGIISLGRYFASLDIQNSSNIINLEYHMSTIIGKITSIEGVFYVKAVDGSLHGDIS